jgi:hypothetical protein
MQEFLNKIRAERAALIVVLTGIKSEGKTIAGYGAPAKATTLLSFLGVADMIDFIVDDSPLKQGRFMPGSHIPIVASSELYKRNPDYVFILAWNFADPIIKKLKEGGYKGQCIVPFK